MRWVVIAAIGAGALSLALLVGGAPGWSVIAAQSFSVVLIALSAAALLRAAKDPGGAGVLRQELDPRSTAEASRPRREAAFLDAVAEPVVVTGPDGLVLSCNAAAASLLVGNGARIAGRSLEELVTNADLLAMHRAASRGKAQSRRVRMIRAEGAIVLDATAAPIESGVVLTLRDVTELAAAAQLKADFVANASHELRTPLASIIAAAETLREFDDEKVRTRAIDLVASNASRLQEMIADLFNLSRLETPDAEPEIERFMIEDVVGELASMFERACEERGVDLLFSVGGVEVETDRRMVLLVLRNLVDNAVKFAREGTPVRVLARGEGDVLVLEVADRGIGIPIEHQGRVFERFFQVDPSRAGRPGTRGTGLGLAIVKHAVRTLGGTVELESVWRQGTTVRASIPGCVVTA